MEDLENFKRIRRSDCLKFEEFDKQYNVKTSHLLDISKDGKNELVPGIVKNSDLYPNSCGFQNAAIPQIEMIYNVLQKYILNLNSYTFIDIGCGSGKVILYNLIKEYQYGKYVGIEIDDRLSSLFVENLKTCNVDISKWPTVEVFQDDALKYVAKNENSIYYVFSPFPAHMFEKFLSQNKDILFSNNTIIVEIGNCPPLNFAYDENNIPEKSGFTKFYSKNLINFYKNF